MWMFGRCGVGETVALRERFNLGGGGVRGV